MPQLPGARVRSRRGGAAWQVAVSNAHDLARLAPVSIGMARITELEVAVEHWSPPTAGWLGRPGIDGLVELQVARKDKGVVVRVVLAEPRDAGAMLAAALRCLQPTASGRVGRLLTFASGLSAEAAPLAARIVDVLTPEESRDAHVRRCDTLVVPSAASEPAAQRAETIVVTTSAWMRDGAPFDIDVDPAVQRPVGRRSSGGVVAHGSVSATGLALVGTDVAVAITGDVTAADVRALRGVRAVVCAEVPSSRTARQLAACGVLVVGSDAALPDADDDLEWQARSVHERRHMLRQYGPSVALNDWPSVTVVLATNRPDHLEQALRQVSGLRYPNLEIVIGAHGDRVDPARVRELAQDVPHAVTVVGIDSTRTLGEVLQACSDRAEGALITKMDDDDVYGPEHIWDLVLAREYSGAQVVGKALDWIYLESQDATVFRPTYPAERYADFVAGGTILISRADLLAVGGWRPVPKSVDRALLDRVLSDGGLVYRTHGLGYVYVRHSSGHTASVSDAHFLTKISARYEGMVKHEAFGTGA